jgi:Predicted 3'-5' exonuclease related to the exonuclease domain of PolB
MKQHRRQPRDSTSEDMIFEQLAISWNFLADEFQEIIGIEPPSDFKLRSDVDLLLKRLDGRGLVPAEERRIRLLAMTNKKFEINAGRIIADYCKSDVINTYRLWLRHELFRGRLDQNQFELSEENVATFI